MLRNFKGYEGGYYWSDANIEDDFDFPDISYVSTKIEEIEDNLKDAIKGPEDEYYITFLSGTGSYGNVWPYVVA